MLDKRGIKFHRAIKSYQNVYGNCSRLARLNYQIDHAHIFGSSNACCQIKFDETVGKETAVC